MKRAHSYRYNVLLVKDDVGRPKPNTRKLPPNCFTYGKPEIRDIEDATAGKCQTEQTDYSSIQLHRGGTIQG